MHNFTEQAMKKLSGQGPRLKRTSEIDGKRVLQLLAQGKSWQEIAWTFGVDIQRVKRAARKVQ